MKNTKPTTRNAWAWVPSLYYAEGIPYVIVMTVAVIMYKRLGISNTDIALYTSWLYLPWVIKPLWSPIVDIFRTKRFWIITMQLIIGAGLGGVALTIPLPNYFQYTLGFLWLLAFSSATHDIAADGFYMLGLNKHDQAFFVGIRSTFYRIAMITGQGILIIFAGYFESTTGLTALETTVHSSPNYSNVQFINPDSIKINALEGDLRIVTEPGKLTIGTQPITKTKADSLKSFFKKWNAENGFYKIENESKNSASKKAELNWLEKFLKDNFGQKQKAVPLGDFTGNLGIMYFHLSGKPDSGEEIVVTFGQEGGDKSISLIEGTRFIFNENNWNKPAFAIIQLDPKLKLESTAEFTARAGNIPLSWVLTFSILTILFFTFFLYHKFILPHPVSDKPAVQQNGTGVFSEFLKTFVLFFKRGEIIFIIAYLLLYRLGESQLVKMASPFMLDAREIGGLGLTTGEVGLVYGTVGIVSLTLGGLLGGFLASKHGLKFWLWWMVMAINLPNLVYVYLSATQPESFFIINLCVAIEQFGYGFGFTAYMLYMIYVSDGDHKTAHFAITTGFMALGMMIPGMMSGWLQELIGYENFFVWVVAATIPAFILTKFIKLDSDFGKKVENESTS
ncbi:MAG: MFS transporter [Ignavibacteriae bacterium HGW-Ignavibacteriae-2]|jgi:PAT family beta-lactamase induction signal transducer AmpG|nr:MAG: MFS transporter [Ignavibacteriae bacterium HGW-Ignavibacteriae-2]